MKNHVCQIFKLFVQIVYPTKLILNIEIDCPKEHGTLHLNSFWNMCVFYSPNVHKSMFLAPPPCCVKKEISLKAIKGWTFPPMYLVGSFPLRDPYGSNQQQGSFCSPKLLVDFLVLLLCLDPGCNPKNSWPQ